MRVLDIFHLDNAPRTRGANPRVAVLMRMLVLVAVWQLVGPVAVYSGLSVGVPVPVAFNAPAGSDTHSMLLTDGGSDTDQVDDELQLLPGWSQRAVGPGDVALELPLFTSRLIARDELRRPAGRTESPPVPPPLSQA